ncbi:MAG: NAD(+)/NADH kinase [Bacteroidota bacterium]
MIFGLYGNLSKKEVVTFAVDFISHLTSKGSDFIVHDKLAKLISKSSNLRFKKNQSVSLKKLILKSKIIVACGGDGTILSIANAIGKKETPILGINLGKLGFLTESSTSNAIELLDEILLHNYRVESRTMIEVNLNRKKYFGLNDVVVDKGSSSRVVSILALINNSALMNFIGDGILVATPTGTTGYSLATGGPIVSPSSEVFAVSPICAHTLTTRSLVVPDESVITIHAKSEMEKIRLTIDGQQKVLLTSPLKIKIRKANHVTNLIKRIDSNYYDVLRKKLLWSNDARAKEINEK